MATNLVTTKTNTVLLVDTNSLKTYAQAGTLDLLAASGRKIGIVDAVLVELRRQPYADNKIVLDWLETNQTAWKELRTPYRLDAESSIRDISQHAGENAIKWFANGFQSEVDTRVMTDEAIGTVGGATPLTSVTLLNNLLMGGQSLRWSITRPQQR
jgi:hypothetical protein